jgi:cytoskeleton protein RodZ
VVCRVSAKGRSAVSVGAMIVQARTAAGMSVSDVSAATKIRPAVLQAIERDDYSLCGGDAYAKGQLRSIARAIGLDPESLLATFDGRPPPGTVDPSPAAVARRGRRRAEPVRRGDRPRPRVPEQLTVNAMPAPSGEDGSTGLARLSTPSRSGRSFNWTAAMLVAILALAAVGVFSAVTRNSGSDQQNVLSPPTSAAATDAPTSAPQPTATPTTTPSVTDDTLAQATQVEVTVDVIGDASWLSVTEGKSTSLFEGLVELGDTQTFVSEKKVRVVVGNAGAVTLTVNGQELGSPGGLGEVRRLEFSPDDPALA